MSSPTPGVPVPTVFKYELDTSWFRKFPWKQRLMILFGANLAVEIHIACKHSPGAIQPTISGVVTKCLTWADYLKEQSKNIPKEEK